MSLKRPLSPESNNDFIHNDTRQLKRLKLHSIIQQLRNEEAKLILLKKLRANQQLTTRTNKSSTTVTNGFHPTATRLTTNTTPAIPLSKPITNIPSQQPSIPRKTSNSPLLTNSNKISSHHSFEERKNQAKSALSKQLERELLSIPPPKPTLQDIPFIPNGNSLEFPPLIGLEDVIQCLSELQNDRHRLPQRFTDHALIDNPYICDQCGTDYTIRWWKHLNTKLSNEVINILCDRCKKQVLRRTSKSKHSTLLKNIFLSGIKQEKEIEKNFHTLIKQEKQSSQIKSSITTNPQSMITTTPNYIPTSHQQYQIKNSLPQQQQHFATKISQQSTRKSNGIVQSQNHHSRSVQHTKSAMPIHHQQKPFRSTTALPQQTKTNQMVKPPKISVKQQNIISSARSIFPSNPDLIHAFLTSNLNVRPTATKRRTVPTVEFK
jgi:hypothetical protein